MVNIKRPPTGLVMHTHGKPGHLFEKPGKIVPQQRFGSRHEDHICFLFSSVYLFFTLSKFSYTILFHVDIQLYAGVWPPQARLHIFLNLEVKISLSKPCSKETLKLVPLQILMHCDFYFISLKNGEEINIVACKTLGTILLINCQKFNNSFIKCHRVFSADDSLEPINTLT